jgi:hypothetical protein
MSCFVRNPVDFHFKSSGIQNPAEPGFGASLLVEAIEAIDQSFLLRIWEPYADWRIRFRSDPEIHNSLVKEHLAADTARLRRLLRLAVSGSISLEPPTTLLTDEIDQIEKSFASGDWRQVLGVDYSTADSGIKQAYRKLARRFHPDRWITSADMKLRDRIERTFQKVSHAYSELQNPHPTTHRLIAGTKQKKSFWEKMSGFVRTTR